MKMNPVVHFEMPYDDAQRAADFYAKAFGWKAQVMGEDFGHYVVAQTSESDETTRVPKKPGMINGGFFKKTKDNQLPSVVIHVEDVREAMKSVEANGGTVVGGQKPDEPDDIPGIGLYSAFLDTEGNRVGMLQPHPM